MVLHGLGLAEYTQYCIVNSDIVVSARLVRTHILSPRLLWRVIMIDSRRVDQ